MARRGFLDYVLGGAVGGLEGLAQKRAAEEERKRMADAAAMDRARLLMQLNYRVAPDAYDTEDPAARSVLPPLEMPSAAPPSATRAGGALSAALNRGFGVDATKPSLSRPSFGAAPLELDSRTTRMTEVLGRGQEARAAQEAIAASVDLGGGMKVRFNAPESAAQITARKLADYEAQKRADAAIAAQAKADERKALDENARALAEVYVSAFVDRNGKPISAAQALAAAKSGKTPLELGFSEKPMSAYESGSLAIAQRNAAVNEGKLKLDQGGTMQGEMMNGLQAMGKARAATALNLLETNTKIMKQFEDDLRAGKLQMTGIQLEAARKALAGTPGSAIAEEALNKGNFAIDKNPALLRYIRAGKSIASAVREITPRGGSNLMMQMEIALSGIGPGGTDPESLAQVDAFRNDLLMGVRTGVEAMTGKPSGGTEGGGSNAPRRTMSGADWMQQNPKRDDETKEQYRARYNQRGG